jgi:signal transduction histidine kinase
MVKKLPFKVSAKAARLIGRENVSSAEGAMSELVKNTYDADAEYCLIFFFQKFKSLPDIISGEDYSRLEAWGLQPDQHYKLDEESNVAHRDPLGDQVAATSLISHLRELWLVDNGTGMSAEAIEENWMVIGTNNKEENAFSGKGRVRSGAKGIGRFALDRLGTSCQLLSRSFDTDEHFGSLEWKVDWRDFDDAGRTLDAVTASVQEGAESFIASLMKVQEILASNEDEEKPEIKNDDTGTIIIIRDLYDCWHEKRIEVLRRSLSTLVPPAERRSFGIYLFDDGLTNEALRVGSDVTNDYDYKIEAVINEQGNIKIEVDRNELNHSEFSDALFDLEDMQEFPFRKEDFSNRVFSFDRRADIFLGKESDELLRKIQKLGPFKITLRFFKLAKATKSDSERYPYRSYQTGRRKEWLELFGGIRIYRDNFNVRPYGDPDGPSADWLSLGARRSQNPAQASRKNWTVGPQNLAGTVSISRHLNPDLNDQSNRGGIINNEEFQIFQRVLMQVIREFERDRSTIHYNLSRLYDEENKPEKAKSEGAKLAEEIKVNPSIASNQSAIALSRGFKAQEAEIKELKAEQVMLRSLATLGTVLVSFSHEMAQLQTAMSGRSKDLEDLLRDYISESTFSEVDDAFNPFVVLRDWAKDDKKVKQWFSFALSSVRPERRRRRKIDFLEHLSTLEELWSGFLVPKQISLSLKLEEGLRANMLAHEIDIDSVFNNLIVNSYESFNEAKLAGERKIEIEVQSDGPSEIIVLYRDNGPGLASNITKPNSIFDYSVTTKTDKTGNLNGTGLGMWILDTIVRDYQGTARVHKPSSEAGFRIDIRLPIVKA